MAKPPDATPIYKVTGKTIASWAGVELQVSSLFNALMKHPLAPVIWDRIRSFEAKMQMLNDVANRTIKNDEIRRDWRLLYAEVIALSAKRNRVAHATMVHNGHVAAMQPFYSLENQNREPLQGADIDAFCKQFIETFMALSWLTKIVEALASPHQEFAEPTPDLVHRLRREDDRKREGQQHRAQAWREYLDRNPDLKGSS